MKVVYFFGQGQADGKSEMVNLLGGKGANLAEMTHLGIPVPPGFTLTTELCNIYYEKNYSFPDNLNKEVQAALEKVEAIMGNRFGDENNPLLLSIRSGARRSMPGMMETVLNVGLTTKTMPGLIRKTGNPRFVYDSYRRLIMMYSDVVMEKAQGKNKNGEEQGIRLQLEKILHNYKQKHGYVNDVELSHEDWKKLIRQFLATVEDVMGEKFPDDPHEQFWGGIEAVFKSWNGRRARSYRRIEGIPDEWGTAVNVQAMVYGNTGDLSATGVAFTRNPATGENLFFGEWLKNAQGEDVVAGTRTPNPLNETTRRNESEHLESLETFLPEVYRDLNNIRKKLELHYRDMQDMEFTIENKHLWMLQTRTGKRNGQAAIQMAVDMVQEKLISRKEAVLRIHPDQIDELLHPNLDPGEENKLTAIAHGLPAGPGGGYGQIVFTADEAETWAKAGKKVILLREETSPEDVHGMHSAEAILTARGGMTSHAALVARGWGKCCIVGCSVLDIDLNEKTVTIKNVILKEGDWISLNGNNGNVYVGKVPLLVPDINLNQAYHKLMSWADEFRTLKIRTNAESPADAAKALEFGAEGIGLCRTEHMFFETDRIKAIRKMILADNKSDRRTAVMELLPYQKEDFKGILKVMQGRPVTIRLLDPPLHEFINLDDDQIDSLARELGVSGKKIKTRISALHEINPMLGHRGCRLGIVYPEITEMQSRAIFEAAAELTKAGIKVLPEIMIPLVGTHAEYLNQEKIVRDIASIVQKEMGQDFDYLVGTMIELPRACLTADSIAKKAEFFSFGTNDLTQTTFGYSRDDIGVFLTDYLDNKILDHDPFQSLDIRGVGQLMEIGVNKGRSVRPDLKIGICGEHGGDPDSIEFCFKLGLNYVSCSPFRVPVARLAAAQAFLRSDG